MSRYEAAIAVNRFGLGARTGDLQAAEADPRGWLGAQLRPETALPQPIAGLPSTGEDQWAFWSWLIGTAREQRKRRKQEGAEDPAKAFMRGDMPGNADVEASFRETFYPRYERALAARFAVATTTETPFFERLVHFWSNHFVVSAAKQPAIAMPPSFETDVIRPHVVGRFEDMLLASTRHPAMLFYLDNASSIGPGSKEGKKGPRKARFLPIDLPYGLNENLAREILELQTLGVDGGYTQADVTSFARVLTGWRIRWRPFFKRWHGADDLFRYDEDAHEPGAHVVLGKRYAEPGSKQGEAVLHDLVRHPSTSRFIATKLVRHFIADEPPPAAVDRVATVFQATQGDLLATSRALIECPEAWRSPYAKFKSPEEFLISATRASGGPSWSGRELHEALDQMGARTWWAPSPAGWPDVEAEWIGADAIWKRIEWSAWIAERRAGADTDPARLGREVLGPGVSERTLRSLRRAESPSQAMTLLLASPEFQRR
jgi:uncharacterized protein (DUF1800 family)